MHTIRLATLWLSCCTPALLEAQTQPMPGKTDAQVSILQVGDLLPSLEPSLERDETPAQRREARRSALEALGTLLTRFIEPALGKDEEIAPLGLDRLVVTAAPQKIAWLHRTLKLQKEGFGRVLVQRVQIREFSRKEFLARLSGRFDKGQEIELPKVNSVRLGDPGGEQEVERILEEANAAAGKGPRLRRVVTLSGTLELESPQPGRLPLIGKLLETKGTSVTLDQSLRSRWTLRRSVEKLKQTAYIKDFEVERHKATIIANPVVDVIRDGVVLEMAQLDLGGGRVGVDLKLTCAILERPIATHSTTIGKQKVTIQLPDLEIYRLQCHFVRKATEGVLVSLPTRNEQVLVAAIHPWGPQPPK